MQLTLALTPITRLRLGPMPGSMERARLEEEARDKRERELKELELKSRMASLTSGPQGLPGAFEAQMAELRRYGPLPPHLLFPVARGMSLPPGAGAASADAVHSQHLEQMHSEQSLAALSDPLSTYAADLRSRRVAEADLSSAVRFQMQAAGLSELHNHAHTHAHTHAHAHAHLHLHPHDAAAAMAESGAPALHAPHPLSMPAAAAAAAAAAAGLPPGMRPPGVLQRPDLMHAGGLYRPPLMDEQLAQVRDDRSSLSRLLTFLSLSFPLVSCTSRTCSAS